jgi:hypothetical protein
MFEMFRNSAALFFVIALSLSTSPGEAANVSAPGFHLKASHANDQVSSFWPTDPVQCDLVLEGEVAEGDAAKLKELFETIQGNMNAFTFFLCLRSNGGEVSEALKIARFVLDTQRPSIATIVEDAQTCASACALIFLAGNAPARVGAWPQRFLHPRGRLLFHSSRLDLGRKFKDETELLEYLTTQELDGRSLRDKISSLYSDGLRDEQKVISTFNRLEYEREELGGPWVRPSLFLDMFAQDADEWVCVDAVDKVGRWDIQVYGYAPPKVPSKENYLNVCKNAYYWRSDRSVTEAELKGEDTDAQDPNGLKEPAPTVSLGGHTKAVEGFDRRFTLPYQAPLLPLTCVVEVTNYNDGKQVDAQTNLSVFFIGGPGPTSKLTPTSYFTASTLLADLPGVRPSRGSARQKIEFTTFPNTFLNGCRYASIPNVNSEQCEKKCSTDNACVAYSYNKVSRTCDLKNTLTARQGDPLWTTGVASSSRIPEKSLRPLEMKVRGIAAEYRIDGMLLTASKASESISPGIDCADSCMSDNACWASEYDGHQNQCRHFSHVAGIKKISGAGDRGTETYVKTQQNN